MEKILLGQLGASGDCLYATILARQLRNDFPKAHITWAVSTQCLQVVRNNPHVNDIWHVPTGDWLQHEKMWHVFEREAFRRYKQHDFDYLLLSQIWPSNLRNYDGTVRPSLLRSYGAPITVPIENVVELDRWEIEQADSYIESQGLMQFEHRILFECSSRTGQSFLTPDLAQDIADHVYAALPEACIVFSTHVPMELRDPRSRFAGVLTLRESARLTHACTLFVGCGSGGTVAATSTAAKPLPTIQLLAASTSVMASFAHDFEYFGLFDRQFLEMTEANPKKIADCIVSACIAGIATAYAGFDSHIAIDFDHYRSVIESGLFKKHRYLDAAKSLLITAERYGWTSSLIEHGNRIAKQLSLDPSWLFSSARQEGELFRATLAEVSHHPQIEPRQGRWSTTVGA